MLKLLIELVLTLLFSVASIDLVDTTFNIMDIESEDCRKKAVCEVEAMAANNPLFKLVLATVKYVIFIFGGGYIHYTNE